MLTFPRLIEALRGIQSNLSVSDRTEGDFPGHLKVDPSFLTVTGGVNDSRQAVAGSLFIPLPGENTDGHEFVADAFQRGARFALIQRDLPGWQSIDLRGTSTAETLDQSLRILDFTQPVCLRVDDCLAGLQTIAKYWRGQNPRLRVIGITGSVGKSTTKELTAQVLGKRFMTLKNPGNLNNEIGLPLTLLSLTEEHECAVLEMGFYVPGEIALLCQISNPQVGVITNIGTVHAERAGSQEAIARGKAELVEALPPSPDGVAILNYDDPLVHGMAGRTRARLFFYGMNPEADLWADEVEGLGLDGIRFRLHYRGEEMHLKVPLIGRHSVNTVLRATAVGLAEGLSWQEIIDGLREDQSQLRLLTAWSASGALILDDTYNASPESTLAALNLLDEMDGHKVAVLGDMLELGPYEEQGHEMVGVRAAEVVDELVTVGKLGRQIAQAAWRAGLSRRYITSVDDCEQAITELSERLKSGDVVLIKGSHGVRMDRIVAALENPS